MKKEKGIFMNDYMLACIDTFYLILEREDIQIETIVQGIKVGRDEKDFKKYYDEFIIEVKENITEYRDVNFIDKYLTTCLNTFFDWDGFDSEIDFSIISKDYEVKYLKKLKENIVQYRLILYELYYGDSGDPISIKLRKIFDDIVNPEQVTELKKIKKEPEVKPEKPTPQKPAFDERFDFDKMMIECSTFAADTIQKIEFIHNRIYDFKQWQIRYDEEETFKMKFSKHESDYKYTSEYYPKFEVLCKLELQRLEKKLELEKKALTHKALENSPVIIQSGEIKAIYSWKSSGTDLLELVSALHKNDSIQRKDGKPLTRKELIDYFQGLFGKEIKDVEGKLTKAGNRNDNTPFLDNLAQQFRNYVAGKEEKQMRRK